MRLIIAGGRTLSITPDDLEASILLAYPGVPISEVVSGRQLGIDRCGEKWAEWAGIPWKGFDADWTLFGWAAGPIRNKAMAEYGDLLLLLWDGSSRGSRSMKKEMIAAGKPLVELHPVA